MKYFLTAIFAFAFFLIISPTTTSAHITDPAHGVWMVDFEDEGIVWPANEPTTFFVSSRYTEPDPPPINASRNTYDIELPEGFVINQAYGSISSSVCTFESNTAHCESGFFPIQNGDTAEYFVITATPTVSDGTYQAHVTSSIVLDVSTSEDPTFETFTDSDTAAITVASKRESDISLTRDTPNTTLTAGAPTTLQYTLKNNGPDAARNVEATFGNTGENATLTSVSPSDACTLFHTLEVQCKWNSVNAGESKTIYVTILPAVSAQVENNTAILYSFARSFEHDPDIENDGTVTTFQIKCANYIAPSAIVDPTAKVAANGCTYVSAGAVLKAHVIMEKGSFVSGGTVVGENTKIGPYVLYTSEHDPFKGKIGAHVSIGTRTYIIGDIGDYATIGEYVESVFPYWVIVEKQATIGSRTKFDTEKNVIVHSKAKIPTNTVVNEAYCQNNPSICTIY